MSRWDIKKRKQCLTTKALKESFSEMHEKVVCEAWIHSDLSGATLTAVLVSNDEEIYVASVGDSHAYLYQFDRTLREDLVQRLNDDEENDHKDLLHKRY